MPLEIKKQMLENFPMNTKGARRLKQNKMGFMPTNFQPIHAFARV
jgi:hypothetical protein